MKKLIFIAFIFICEVSVAQQLPEYRVYFLKGQVTITKPNTKPLQVKQKKFLYNNEDIFSGLQIIDELEKDKWIYSAMRYYENIVHKNPLDIPLLQSYVLFLLKYGFDAEASEAWKMGKN